ncbi:glutathione S-transferase family protein [Pontivivens insulae]|uniref:Glutathionyl-hydroquinone reductase YqjG n=1 Tax=Pontivivens insulae TaxID=1639689 RepID=A0A2R8AF86_9RHOB|nr:glutathione S-transferase family protein [Pontivivens insulae]RED12101.1 putative glutathione S-transferase [Pontivivens insulae]SPF30857.1 Glutathionyl-hydroquinone reductase YqjG [Pontivivens insulae]
MGKLVDGEWITDDVVQNKDGGAFNRQPSSFRNWITSDGAPGPTGTGGFKAESGRYHLYVSYACPWAHRTLIFRALKDLTQHIDISVVHPDMYDDGWTFDDSYPGATGDTLMGKRYAREIYQASQPDVTGRVTVPILWDKQTAQIVSNESSEIIRMFNSAFNDLTGNTLDFWPEEMRDEIEEVNERIYHTLNNGVYKSGFAGSQAAYDAAVVPLSETMDWLEKRLATNRYLMGAQITEADWRLVVTLFRFDAVYHGHFKCNRAKLIEYPNLWAYTRELYQWPGVAETVNLDHIIRHYHVSHESINPYRIVPIGPEIDWNEPHGRDAA